MKSFRFSSLLLAAAMSAGFVFAQQASTSTETAKKEGPVKRAAGAVGGAVDKAAEKTKEGAKVAAGATASGAKTVAGKTVEGTKTAASATASGAKTVAGKTAEGTKTAAGATASGAKTAAGKTADGAEIGGRAVAGAAGTGIDKTGEGIEKAGEKIKSVGLLDINSATEKELEALPGIGDKYAANIIAGRPYKSKSELTQKGIIPQSAYEKMKNRVVARQPKS